MRLVYLINVLFFIIISVDAAGQTAASTCDMNDTISIHYKDDADRLAVRHTHKILNTYKDSVIIDEQLSNRYLKAFIAVYNATNLPARDTVVKWLNIHTLASPHLRDFFISADSNLLWMKNLRYNVSPCGQPIIDAAISKYGLQKKNFLANPSMLKHYALFDASFNINTLPLSYMIYGQIPGVMGAGQNILSLDASNVTDSLNINFIDLAFAYRWGDCYSGCMYSKNWIFRVYNDCSVEYRGTYGNQLPVWASIQKQTNLLPDVKIYPNPAKDKVYIDATDSNVSSLNIFDVLGSEVLKVEIENRKAEIDISKLGKGIYIICLHSETGQKQYKILKD